MQMECLSNYYTCEEYIGYAHFYPRLEKDIFHHLYQDPIEVGTHNGHLSTSRKPI
jgi:hypothetical protein